MTCESLVQLLIKRYYWRSSPAEEFAAFLLPMLEYDPRKRASAEDCLASSWLTNPDPTDTAAALLHTQRAIANQHSLTSGDGVPIYPTSALNQTTTAAPLPLISASNQLPTVAASLTACDEGSCSKIQDSNVYTAIDPVNRDQQLRAGLPLSANH